MTFGDFGYGNPHAFYLLLLVFPIGFMLLYHRYLCNKALNDFAAPASLDVIASMPSKRKNLLRIGALTIVLIAAVIAFMEPHGNIRYRNSLPHAAVVQKDALTADGSGSAQTTRRKAYDVIFLLDTSASMTVADTRTGASRLDYAKEIIDECCGRIRGQSAALYSFTSEATALVPMTMDMLFLRLMLKKTSINEGDVPGTDIMEALDAISRNHFGTIVKPTALIILTDGGDTRLEGFEGFERRGELDAIAARIPETGNNEIRVFCVGIGSHGGDTIPGITYQDNPVHSSLDEELLSLLAAKGHGRYYFANDLSPPLIADDIIDAVEEGIFFDNRSEVTRTSAAGISEETGAVSYDHYYQAPLAIAILFLSYTLNPRRRKR